MRVFPSRTAAFGHLIYVLALPLTPTTRVAVPLLPNTPGVIAPDHAARGRPLRWGLSPPPQLAGSPAPRCYPALGPSRDGRIGGLTPRADHRISPGLRLCGVRDVSLPAHEKRGSLSEGAKGMITDGRVARWLVLALDEGVEMAGCGRGGRSDGRRRQPSTRSARELGCCGPLAPDHDGQARPTGQIVRTARKERPG